ncbi:hypothetical protein [Polaromonas sp. SM01]|uniref:hypothetical protein n=1 Tax=Polaromonas sp. SM01 TaxID=3085630 RepID=UPI0029811A1B|nr:hypothetical protein [Polaromonas sp. SM01]MDW5441800.1 hypothetical protein [Polaromonas sp. SM01]
MSALFREQLLAAAEQAAFPAEKTLDPQTGLETLDAESEAALAQVFALFGVTALQPNDDDFDKVINTTCTLAIEVAAHVQGLSDVDGAITALDAAEGWHPDYRAYVCALWQGEREDISRCAAKLRLTGGIPNGSPPLEDGPLG